ncbi:hypothetical protein [Shewanella baltica]|uniref:hypothetical protein n=1 Tax=Shewanella baltica TaxID=62322 RepID=UPI003D7B8ED8
MDNNIKIKNTKEKVINIMVFGMFSYSLLVVSLFYYNFRIEASALVGIPFILVISNIFTNLISKSIKNEHYIEAFATLSFLFMVIHFVISAMIFLSGFGLKTSPVLMFITLVLLVSLKAYLKIKEIFSDTLDLDLQEMADIEIGTNDENESKHI